MRAGATVNPNEVDPVSLYTRIFGPEFQDPNAGQFTPDPEIMLRQSVLSSVKEERDALMRVAGAADRARIDQYFTSLRQIEQQLGMLLKEAPAGRGLRRARGTSQEPAWTNMGEGRSDS